MTTQKTIFVSIGLDEARPDSAHPEIDKVVTLECLRGIFAAAAHDKHRLVLRDHPAVTALAEAFMGAPSPDLITVPETATAHDIVTTYKPDVIFYAGGQDDVVNDHTTCAPHSTIAHVLLYGTGGAAATIAAAQNETDNDMGFYRMHRALAALRPAP